MKFITGFTRIIGGVVRYAEGLKKILSIGFWIVDVVKYAQERWNEIVKTDLSDLVKREVEQLKKEEQENEEIQNERSEEQPQTAE